MQFVARRLLCDGVEIGGVIWTNQVGLMPMTALCAVQYPQLIHEFDDAANGVGEVICPIVEGDVCDHFSHERT